MKYNHFRPVAYSHVIINSILPQDAAKKID